MKALTYVDNGRFEMTEKAVPELLEATDAIVRVTLSSICTSDLHILHGSVPMARPGITVPLCDSIPTNRTTPSRNIDSHRQRLNGKPIIPIFSDRAYGTESAM